jgi:hypothetical protein
MSKKPGVPITVLSLHQPYASMLAYGLKRVEGRGWNSDFRGDLWIHAASKEGADDHPHRFRHLGSVKATHTVPSPPLLPKQTKVD